MINLKHVLDFYHSSRPRLKASFGVFANVVPHGEGYIGSCRSGTMGLGDRLKLITFDSDYGFLKTEDLCDGEDPRCFLYKGVPYALSCHVLNRNISEVNYRIINLLTKKVVDLRIDGLPPRSGLHRLGKNWMPLVQGDILYLVVTTVPEVLILQCDLEEARCSWITPYDTTEKNMAVTEHRGGTPFIFHDVLDCFVGIGHRTYGGSDHKPYMYTLSRDLKDVVIGPDLDTKFDNGVQDPLSIYKREDRYYCCIASFPTHAKRSKTALTSLYEIVVCENL